MRLRFNEALIAEKDGGGKTRLHRVEVLPVCVSGGVDTALEKSYASPDMEKILFDLGKDAWHGFTEESVWATPLHGDVFRIENTPFFASGVSYKDTLRTQVIDGVRRTSSIVARAGHSTFRIIVLGSEHKSDLFPKFWIPLEKLGCSYEHGEFGYQLFAVDVPNTSDFTAVCSVLEAGEQGGAWAFEEGHFGHELVKKVPPKD